MKNTIVKLVRIGLRIHSLFHLLEFISALYEQAYITATIAFIAMFLELLASFLIPKEHIHIKPFISDVHESCEKQ
ncbi:hypothetical protein N9F79_02470 [Flavobacteriaceae bacterium]|jgi:hypothetical protein|nr:hypothetical protein [Flavobacteriaceae bacterium]MDA9000335.1 hypothetical protein [Flavobacteriaceae bacterium]MDB0022884.1 hypothetical protein [Flavobacteriaceae bacterium]MDB2648146.1 hypothetical protein [Flavobacteriaceae bacterium]MDB4601746.1 hypothetical protein [Flavobacteriaceae bacterium]